MKKLRRMLLPMILMIWPYLFFLLMVFSDTNEDVMYAILWVYIGLTGVVYLANTIYAFVYKSERTCYELAQYDLAAKLIHIPFYVLVFGFGVLMFFAMVVPALVLVSPLVITILFVVDVCLMLTSSMYGASALIKAAAQRKVSVKYAVLHIVLHCFFLTDVISAFCVFFKMRGVRKREFYQ